MKKIVSLISAIILMFSLVLSAFTANAEGSVITVGSVDCDYTTLKAAIEDTARTDGDTIKLLEDRDELVLNIDKTITVDLNGFTLTALKSRLFQNKTTAENTTLTVKNGTLVTANRNNVDTGAAENFGNLIYARATNSFTLDSVKVTSTVDKAGDAALGALLNFTTSSVTRTKIVINNSEISHTGSSGYVLKFYNTDDNYDISITNSIIKTAKDPVYATKGTFEISDSTIETTAERIGSASESNHYSTLTIADGQAVKAYDKDGAVTEYKTADELTEFKNSINSTVANGGKEYYKAEFFQYSSATEYDVTIDDTAKKVAEGEEFTFPDTADLYVGEGTVYQAGDTITVNSACTFKSYDLKLTMQTGAAIRLNIENGIRYSTDVDKDVVAALKEAGATISFGTIIAPENKITDEFTHEDVNIDVEYKVDIGGVYNPNGFVGSIIRIKDANVNQKYVGRGYAKVTVGEVTITVYATQSDNSRSVAYIAKAYKEANYNGDSLGDETKAIVNAWADAYQA